jgi:hypothetical protein
VEIEEISRNFCSKVFKRRMPFFFPASDDMLAKGRKTAFKKMKGEYHDKNNDGFYL